MDTFDVNNVINSLSEETKSKIEPISAETKATETSVEETKVEVKVEEPKVETKVTETESTKTETKTEVADSDDWFDRAIKEQESKAPTSEKAENVHSNTDPETQTELQRLREMEALIQKDAKFKAILEGVKLNKTTDEVLQELQGPDIKSMSPVDLFTYDLKAKGFNDDEIAELAEGFLEKSPAQQKLETLPVRDKMIEEGNKRLEQFGRPDTTIEARRTANIDKALKELDTMSHDLVGKEMYGVTITPEISNKIKSIIEDNSVIGDPDSGYDIPKSIDSVFKSEFTALIAKTAATKAANKERERMLGEVSRPDKGIVSRPGSGTTKDSSAERADLISKIFNS